MLSDVPEVGMRELLHDHRPGEQLEHLLQQVATFQGKSFGGKGWPRKIEVYANWAARDEAMKKKSKSLTAEERYGDIASKWAALGHPPVTWKAVSTRATRPIAPLQAIIRPAPLSTCQPAADRALHTAPGHLAP